MLNGYKVVYEMQSYYFQSNILYKLYKSQNVHTFSLYSSLYGKINDKINTRDVSNIARKHDKTIFMQCLLLSV